MFVRLCSSAALASLPGRSLSRRSHRRCCAAARPDATAFSWQATLEGSGTNWRSSGASLAALSNQSSTRYMRCMSTPDLRHGHMPHQQQVFSEIGRATDHDCSSSDTRSCLAKQRQRTAETVDRSPTISRDSTAIDWPSPARAPPDKRCRFRLLGKPLLVGESTAPAVAAFFASTPTHLCLAQTRQS